MASVTREEFNERVGILEREVDGEKLVTRHILEQTRRNGDDIAALRTRMARVEEKVDQLDHKVDRLFGQLDRKIDTVDSKVDGLARDLPRIIAETMREVLKEQSRKR
jgi:uncharacterized protein YoxC